MRFLYIPGGYTAGFLPPALNHLEKIRRPARGGWRLIPIGPPGVSPWLEEHPIN